MPPHQLHLHHYPKQEILADHLIQQLADEGKTDPLHSSTVLVRNQGMATWLRQRIVAKNGVAMQTNFPQPNAFLQEILVDSSIQLEDFKWPVFQALADLSESPDFKLIADYITSSNSKAENTLKRYQLADQIAVLFDKYLLSRPDWIAAWNKRNPAPVESPHEPWQRLLWLHLTGGEHQHWSQRLLASDSLPINADLPTALHVFGISNLAPIYVRFLHLLSQRIPVHIYWMNPVSADEGYWEDAPTTKQWILANAFQDKNTLTDSNPLLASFGRMGREFIHTIYGGQTGNIDPTNHQSGPAEIDTPSTTLGEIQKAIHRRAPISENIPIDSSLEIHACHTPLRELETLKTYLLTLAENNPTDTSEILVLCPDISAYAPGIQAVFGISQPDEPYLPFRIADRTSPLDDPNIAAVITLLNLRTSRFTNLEALELLSLPAISNHLGLTESDLDTIRTWISETGIHWGFNENHVKSVAPASSESPWTWRQGLDRLLLGAAMPNPPGSNTLWREIPPYHHIEGNLTIILNALTTFIDWTSKIRNQLSKTKSLTDWIELTRTSISEGFDQSPETIRSLKPLQDTLERFTSQSEILTEEIPAEVFTEHLKISLADSASSPGFLNGAVTFCEMKPMRAIPANTICLLGLNHDSFPRSTSEVQFDLTKNNRIPGDRTTRDDDTYLFLEAILSARQNLYLSYIGASIKDGTELPPSSALQTLIDATPGLGKSVSHEKLHPFDPAYFIPPTPTSHHKNLLRSAKILSTPPNIKPALAPLSIPTHEQQTSISVAELTRSLTKTVDHFYRHVLQAHQRYDAPPLEETEPLEIENLKAYHLKNEILHHRAINPEIITTWQKIGSIPPAQLGINQLQNTLGNIEDILEQLPETQPLTIDLQLKNLTIQGQIDLTEDQTATFITASKKPKGTYLLTVWLAQILASLQLDQPIPGQIINIADKLKFKKINPPSDPNLAFKNILALHQANQSTPQPHFPETAHAYFTLNPKKDEAPDTLHERRIKAAKSKWLPSQFTPGAESVDPAAAVLFTTQDIFTESDLTDSFRQTCAPIWEDIATHLA